MEEPLSANLHQWLHLPRTQIFPHVVHFLGLRRLVPDEGSILRMKYWTRRHDGMTMKVQKTRNSSAAQTNQKYTANALVLLSLVLKPFSLKQNHCNFEKKILKVLHAYYLYITSWVIDCNFKSVGVRLLYATGGIASSSGESRSNVAHKFILCTCCITLLDDETVDNLSVATTVASVPTVSL